MNLRKIYSFVTIIAITLFAAHGYPDQITPEPTNPDGNTITVNTSDAYNSVNFHNEGTITITNSGILTNNGNLDNLSSVTTGKLTNNGTLNNYGVLTYQYGFHNNQYNNGTLNIYSSGGLGLIRNDLTNSGTLNNWGSVYIDDESTLGNTGTVRNYGWLGPSGNSLGYIQTAGLTVNDGNMGAANVIIGGGTLQGTGTITAGLPGLIIDSGATLHPGDPVGTLTINGPFHSSGTLDFDIEGTDSGQYSVLDINGNPVFPESKATFTGGTIDFDFINGFIPVAGESWVFLLADIITGWDTLSSFKFEGEGTDGMGWDIIPVSGGMELEITKTGTAPVPEPTTMILFGVGFAGAGLYRRMRRRMHQ